MCKYFIFYSVSISVKPMEKHVLLVKPIEKHVSFMKPIEKHVTCV